MLGKSDARSVASAKLGSKRVSGTARFYFKMADTFSRVTDSC